MQSLTNRARPVERKPMTWLERLYMWNIAKGMFITMKHIFMKKAEERIQPGIQGPADIEP
jgi:NADH-quinone oxidoreductase subunit I